MRILIHGLNFSPELVGVGKYTGEMAEWLAARGHEVRAVTAPPFNPEWKVAAGFSARRYTRANFVCRSQRAAGTMPELVVAVAAGSSRGGGSAEGGAEGGLAGRPVAGCAFIRSGTPSTGWPDTAAEPEAGCLSVFRCPVSVPRRPSAAKRILHLVSFALASFPAMLRQIAWKPEIVLVVEPTLFCLPAALVTGRWCGSRTWLHVQDFEADAGFELGLLKSAGLRSAVEAIEGKLMLAFDRVSTISEKMLSRLTQKGVKPLAGCLFPNWVDTSAIFPLAKPSPLRAELGISATEVVALYSGTMSHKQGLDVLAYAAGRLKDRKLLRFVFCGGGAGRAMLADRVGALPNVLWVPLQPLERLNDLLNLADIHLLPQKADAADLVMPSKLTGMLASGRPVVATSRLGTQLAKAIEGRGIVVEPGDVAAFASAIEQLAESPRLRESLGRSAREYACSELEKEKILSQFERQLLKLAAAAG